jgi:hypothetical protein
MYKRMRLAIIIAVLATALAGCSGSSPTASDNSAPGKGQPGVEDPGAGPRKEAQAKSHPPATTREQFMPILTRAHGKVTWPPAYVMTADAVWGFMAAGADDTAYVEEDATTTVEIWNTCAWTLQLIDDVKAGRSVDTDATKLNGLAHGGMRDLIVKIASDAKLGEIGTARQFVTANDCAKGFKG